MQSRCERATIYFYRYMGIPRITRFSTRRFRYNAIKNICFTTHHTIVVFNLYEDFYNAIRITRNFLQGTTVHQKP